MEQNQNVKNATQQRVESISKRSLELYSKVLPYEDGIIKPIPFEEFIEVAQTIQDSQILTSSKMLAFYITELTRLHIITTEEFKNDKLPASKLKVVETLAKSANEAMRSLIQKYMEEIVNIASEIVNRCDGLITFNSPMLKAIDEEDFNNGRYILGAAVYNTEIYSKEEINEWVANLDPANNQDINVDRLVVILPNLDKIEDTDNVIILDKAIRCNLDDISESITDLDAVGYKNCIIDDEYFAKHVTQNEEGDAIMDLDSLSKEVNDAIEKTKDIVIIPLTKKGLMQSATIVASIRMADSALSYFKTTTTKEDVIERLSEIRKG